LITRVAETILGERYLLQGLSRIEAQDKAAASSEDPLEFRERAYGIGPEIDGVHGARLGEEPRAEWEALGARAP